MEDADLFEIDFFAREQHMATAVDEESLAD